MARRERSHGFGRFFDLETNAVQTSNDGYMTVKFTLVLYALRARAACFKIILRLTRSHDVASGQMTLMNTDENEAPLTR